VNGSENGRGAASSLISRATREPRTRAAVSWSEFLPRYLLIEQALEKRNVLEVGTLDIRSLVKLYDSGAARVLGTSADPSRFDRSVLRGRAIDVLRMEPGNLDFGDTAFDVILVVDLAKELAHNPGFVAEVRRILRPDGFCLLGYGADGRSLVELIDDDPKVLAMEPNEIEAGVRAIFPDARFYLQSPFVGVTIHPKGLDPSEADVSLDPSLATTSRPSHVIAFCGRAPEAAYRTLVELPFVAFQALTEAAQERAQSDLSRVLDALRSAREQIAARDRSLEAIKRRLPKIRDAILASRNTSTREPSEALPSPTVLDRPTEDGRLAELELRQAELEQALQRERGLRIAAEAKQHDYAADLDRDTFIQDAASEALERALFDREQENLRLEAELVALRQRDTERAGEIRRLESRARALEADLDDAVHSVRTREADQGEAIEARRRITQLERTASMQEQELEDLRQQLESQFVVRHSLGDEFRDAESRIAFLNARIEDLALGHSQELKRAEERIQFLAGALNSADMERENLRERLAQIEEGTQEMIERSDHAERGRRDITQELESERSERYLLRGHVDELRIELHEKSVLLDKLERTLADRDAQIAAQKKDHISAGADRKAVELAAAHLSKEVEQLRKRVQELRNERDTLAATSRLLLEERDTAAQLARKAVEAEERAQQLQLSLEGGQAAIERLERELDRAMTERDAIQQRFLDAGEKLRMLEKDLERHRLSSEQANGRLNEEQSKQRDMDRKLAELAERVNAAEASRNNALRDREKIEELMLESHQEAAIASRDVRRLEQRIADLTAQQKLAEQDLGRALQERANAEAEATRARAIADSYRGKNALLVGEVADLERKIEAAKAEGGGRDRALRDQLVRVTRELDQTEVALSKTLSEAAGLDSRLKDLERLAEAGERERIQIEIQRQGAESARRSAEAARSHAVAEVRALTAERAQLVQRFEADLHRAKIEIDQLRNDDAVDREVQRLEEERLALMVWAEELEISKKLAEANAERLRTDSARQIAATEEAEYGRWIAEASADRIRSESQRPAAGNAIDAQNTLLQAENARLEFELTAVRMEVLERADQLDRIALKSSELDQRWRRLQAESVHAAENADLQMAQLSAALDDARQQAAAAETSWREVDRQLSEAVGWLEVTEQRAVESEAKLSRTANELLDVDEKLLDTSAELEKVRAERAHLEQKNELLQAELHKAAGVAEQVERLTKDAISLRSALTDGARRIALLDEAEREAVELRGELAGVQAEASDLRAKLEASVAELGWANSEGAALRSKLHASGGRIAELEAELAGARDRTASLELAAKEASELGARLAKVERRAAELQAALASAELKAASADAAVHEAGELRLRVQEAQRKSAELEKQLQEAQAGAAVQSMVEKAARAEQQTARVEGLLAKETSAAREAETRARNAEVLARNSEERASSADSRRRTAEVRALDAEAKAKHAERRVFEAEQRVKQLESQLERSEGSGSRTSTLEQALDEARAEIGRKLNELKAAKEERANVDRELDLERQARQILEEKLSRQGDAERLKEDVDVRDQQVARLRAEASSMTAEKNRLRALIQSSEQNQVQLERRIAELETSLAEANQQIEILRRDLSERTERLRRMSSGINEPG
jgi:chromosome segregation ATPase